MKKKLLTNGKAFKRTDNRWGGTVWYMDEQGERKRKSFSGTTKAEVNKKMTAYIAEFNQQLTESDESRKTLRESMNHWLQVFKFPSVERGTYDRCECTAKHQIFPLIGEKVVGDITSADLKSILNHWLEKDYAYTTVKKVHDLLGEYFRYLTEQELLNRNPMLSVPMMKKANFMAAQNKEDLPTQETITVFTPEEIEKFKAAGKGSQRAESLCLVRQGLSPFLFSEISSRFLVYKPFASVFYIQRAFQNFQERNDAMTESKYKTYEELPFFLNSKMIGEVLSVSPASSYELLHQEGFPTLKIGNRLVVPKEKFIQWVEQNVAGGQKIV